MKTRTRGLVIGSAIVLIGVLSLLINLDVLRDAEDLVGGVILLGLGGISVGLLQRYPKQWWLLFPGVILTALGVCVLLDSFLYFRDEVYGAALFFSLFGLFGYLSNRFQHWWPILPAGMAFTLGTIVILDGWNLLFDDLLGAVFFTGVGLTFFFLYTLRNEQQKLDWALYPALGSVALALLVVADNVRWLSLETLFPVALIAVGIVILINAVKR